MCCGKRAKEVDDAGIEAERLRAKKSREKELAMYERPENPEEKGKENFSYY